MLFWQVQISPIIDELARNLPKKTLEMTLTQSRKSLFDLNFFHRGIPSVNSIRTFTSNMFSDRMCGSHRSGVCFFFNPPSHSISHSTRSHKTQQPTTAPMLAWLLLWQCGCCRSPRVIVAHPYLHPPGSSAYRRPTWLTFEYQCPFYLQLLLCSLWLDVV